MPKFFTKLWRWIKSWFAPKPSPVSLSAQPELSDLEYENVLIELLEKVVQGNNWIQLQEFLSARKIKKAELARWLNSFGQRWLSQPEQNQELAQSLILLGQVATGELAQVAKSLGENISRQEAESQEDNKEPPETNHQSSAPTVEPVPNQDAENCFNQGVALAKLGKYEEALAFFDQTLTLNSDYYQAWGKRGLALEHLDRYEEALASFDQALTLNSDYYQAWNYLGRALLNLGRYEEALASFDQALTLNPDYDAPRYNRANALIKLGRYEEAAASYGQAFIPKTEN